MSVPYLQILVMSVCAAVFYRAGQLESSWGTLWAALSVAASVLALRFLPWGLIGVLAAQGVLFFCITLCRMRRQG